MNPHQVAEELCDLINSKQDPEVRADIRESEPMSAHTTFRVGGPAEVFVTASEGAVGLIRSYCDKMEVPLFLIGHGSNLLVPDEGLKGVVLTLEAGDPFAEVTGDRLIASAGALLGSIAGLALSTGLGGLEFAAGIPGTVGGGVVMNAGAYGGELKDILTSARVLTRDGEIRSVSPEGLSLSYRHSSVEKNGWFVLSAEFLLHSDDTVAIRERMDDFTKRRREKQPLEFPSAGSTFKRPEGYFAGKLIEDAGLRGFSIGDAAVSEKHCGFVINRGNATASDILALIREVQKRVYESSGVKLEPEVKILCDL